MAETLDAILFTVVSVKGRKTASDLTTGTERGGEIRRQGEDITGPGFQLREVREGLEVGTI